MKEVEIKPVGEPKEINKTRENDGTFLRVQLCIKGFSLVDFIYHFTSKKKLKEK